MDNSLKTLRFPNGAKIQFDRNSLYTVSSTGATSHVEGVSDEFLTSLYELPNNTLFEDYYLYNQVGYTLTADMLKSYLKDATFETMKVTTPMLDISVESGEKLIVDRRFISYFERSNRVENISTIKDNLIRIINSANSVEQMYEDLDEQTYLNKVLTKLSKLEA